MASSLLFRIKSTFDSAGFKEAQSGFTGVLGTLGKLTMGAASLAFGFKNLGSALGVLTAVQLLKFTKFLFTTNAAAVQAQSSIVRLRTQLDLLGQGGAQNLSRITKFAQQTATTTRFSAQEIEEAITVAIRRTGNLQQAIKQVTVAEDIAAATGRDLITVTNLLNFAQAGNTRLIRQITNLRQADIEAAIRQGNLIDILAQKFKGAASKEAGTLAVRLQILGNVTEQLREELGKIGLPFTTFITNIRILVRELELFGVRAAAGIGRGFFGNLRAFLQTIADNPTTIRRFTDNLLAGINPLTAFALGMRQASQDTENFQNKLIALSQGPVFDFDKQFEINTLRLAKTVDQRIQIARDIARADELIRIGQRSGFEVLNEEQIKFLEQFQYGQRAIEQGTRNLTDAQKKQDQVARERRARGRASSPFDIRGDIIDKYVQLNNIFKNTGQSLSALEQFLITFGNESPAAAKRTVEAFGYAHAAIQGVKNVTSGLNEAIKELASPDVIGKLAEVGQRIGQAVEVRFKPALNVNVSFATNPEDIKKAIQEAVAGAGITGFFGKLAKDTSKIIREQTAQSPAV